MDARPQRLRRVHPKEIIGCQGGRRTRTLYGALQSAIPLRRRPLSTGGSRLCDATALDTIVSMLNPQPTAGQGYGVANIAVSLLVFTSRHESQQIYRAHQLN
jgi:hypothetical protein